MPKKDRQKNKTEVESHKRLCTKSFKFGVTHSDTPQINDVIKNRGGCARDPLVYIFLDRVSVIKGGGVV